MIGALLWVLQAEIEDYVEIEICYDSKYADASADVKDACSSATSQFYFQVPCEIEDSLIEGRDQIQIMGLTTVLFVFFFSILYIDYVDNVQALSFIDWDVKTITAGDYSIEFDITNETYEAW